MSTVSQFVDYNPYFRDKYHCINLIKDTNISEYYILNDTQKLDNQYKVTQVIDKE